MNFTQERQESMPLTNTKGSTRQEIDKGTDKIKRKAKDIANKPQVVAATQAAKKGAKETVNTFASIFGMGKDTENTPPPPNQFGGKRRRKSRRKKRR